MSSIGQGGPSSPFKEEWPAPIVVLEAFSRFVSPQTIRFVHTQTGRYSQRIRRLPARAVTSFCSRSFTASKPSGINT